MIGKIRIYSGLTLFIYVLGHLINHSLGLISFDALNAGLKIHVAVWRSWPGSILLYGALFLHVALALWRLFARRNLKFKAWEGWQVVLGFLIPIFMGTHVIANRGGGSFLGVIASYELQQLVVWVSKPVFSVLLPIGLLVVWIHGCVGIHFWLRLRPWYGGVRMAGFALSLLIPTLALAGFVASGVEATRQARDPAWIG